MTVSTDEEGEYFYRSGGGGGQTCGVYFVTRPEARVEIEVEQLDVDCDGGLVVVRKIPIESFFRDRGGYS